jgi:hypothetical protein
MNVEIGAEIALFPEKEYIKGIFVAVYASLPHISPLWHTVSNCYCHLPPWNRNFEVVSAGGGGGGAGMIDMTAVLS